MVEGTMPRVAEEETAEAKERAARSLSRPLARAARRSKERATRRLPMVMLCRCVFAAWLGLFFPLHAHLASAPLWALCVYDVTLAWLGVLMRAFSSAKTGALPFWHACSRLKAGNVRGFLAWLHLVQAIHLHACARLETRLYVRMVLALLTTIPWWMDRRGGWTIVLRGASSFGEIVNEQPTNSSTLSLLLSHVFHLHGLFHGLNLTCALSVFAEAPGNHNVVDLAHFRLYWFALNVTTSADVLLQPLVDRRWLSPRVLQAVLAASVLAAAVFALPVLAEHVSVHGAIASFVLWWGREHCAFSNVLIALGFSQAFEVVSLLANRYSIVDV